MTLQNSVISFDPGGVQDSQSLFVSRQVSCQLVRTQGSIFILDAAESIKYINPLKVILKINQKIKFHDGAPVTAKDVLASFNYIKTSRNVFNNIFFWVKKVEIIDNKTLIFELDKHIPQFFKVFSTMNFTIFKNEFLEKAKIDKNLWKYPIGCGGYKVARNTDEEIELTPVASGLPIVLHLIKTNQIDANDVAKFDIITVNVVGESNNLNEFEKLEVFDPVQFFIGVNSKSKLWKNKYERCQFLAELDIHGVLDSYGKIAIAANDLLPKGVLGYNPNHNYVGEMADFAKKKQLPKVNLSAKSFCLAYLTVSIQEKHKKAYLKMFEQYSSNIVFKPIKNVKKFGKTFLNKNCDVLLFALKSNYLDGYEYLTVFENNDANFSGLHDKHLDSHILKSQLEENANIRAKEYQKITNEIRNLCFVRPLLTLLIKRIYIKKDLITPEIGLMPIQQYYLGNISR